MFSRERQAMAVLLPGAIPARGQTNTTTSIFIKMESTEKINIRGAIKALDKVDDKAIFPRNDDYKPTTIRNTATSVRSDTGRRFKVEVSEKEITVIRKE